VLQCGAVWCSVLQCVAVCNVVSDPEVHHVRGSATFCSTHVLRYTYVLQCVAVCGCVLQCVAVCCSVLQCVAVCCSVLQ